MNLATARTKGNFHFVDGLTQLTDYAAPNKDYLPKPTATPAPAPAPVLSSPSTPRIPTTRTAPPAAAPQPVLSYSPKLLDFYKFLENLIRDVAKGPASPGGRKQLCLILDDLSVLLNCGWPCREVLALVRYLKQLVAKVNSNEQRYLTGHTCIVYSATNSWKLSLYYLAQWNADHVGSC